MLLFTSQKSACASDDSHQLWLMTALAAWLGFASDDVLFAANDNFGCFSSPDCTLADSNWPFLSDRVRSTTLCAPLRLVAIPFLFFRAGTGIVDGISPSGKFRLLGFCRVFTALGISLTSVVYHFDFEFPTGISDGLLPGVVTSYPVTLL